MQAAATDIEIGEYVVHVMYLFFLSFFFLLSLCLLFLSIRPPYPNPGVRRLAVHSPGCLVRLRDHYWTQPCHHNCPGLNSNIHFANIDWTLSHAGLVFQSLSGAETQHISHITPINVG